MSLQKQQSQQGFTLVELAIVLVIIGLIIGGVLVGQDMIKSAQIRATVAQWEGYNSATNTFRDKFAAVPGDISQTRAVQFGLYDRTAVAAAGNGDTNGLLQACAATAAAGLLAGCETLLFWRDLNTMNLVEGWFQTATEDLGNGGAAITAEEINAFFPEAKLGRGNYWTVFSAEGRNWFELAGITDVSAAGVYTLTTSLSPFEAYNIDRKADDSRPLTGGVRALSSAAVLNTAAAPAAAAAGVCIENADSTYNQGTEAFANTPACQLRMRFM